MKDKVVRNIESSIEVGRALIEGGSAEVIAKIAEKMIECLKSGHKILFFGNGGSASDSQHLAAEFVGRYEKERRALPAIALTTDTSILTAVGNDYGFDEIFSRQIAALGQKGDLVVAISTSGNSPNVLRGLMVAKELGLFTVAFSGRDGGKMRSMADLAYVVPAQKTSRIQESHILAGHILCELVDESFVR